MSKTRCNAKPDVRKYEFRLEHSLADVVANSCEACYVRPHVKHVNMCLHQVALCFQFAVQ